jgi:uncharacterized protein HemY
MSAGVIAFLAAISLSVWAFTKLQPRAGFGNNKTSVTGAVVVFVIVFVVVFTLAHLIIKN